MPQAKKTYKPGFSHITVNVIRFGTAAVLCVAPNANKGQGKECWIPYSLIDDPHNVKINETSSSIFVASWFAKKEGISNA